MHQLRSTGSTVGPLSLVTSLDLSHNALWGALTENIGGGWLCTESGDYSALRAIVGAICDQGDAAAGQLPLTG